MKSLLIGLSIAIFLILSAEYGFSRLEIKPAQYESIAEYLDSSPGDLEFRNLVKRAMTDGKIRSYEHRDIAHHILNRDGLYRVSVASDATLVDARQDLHDRVL